MRKISNFCGIFATLFVTTTMVLLASCSQDDDNYDSDMYTLAEMGTRLSGGDPGGGGPAPVNINVPDTVITEFHEFYFFPDSIFYSSGFQHSPFTAIEPSLYEDEYFLEEDIWIDFQKVNNVPTVTCFTYSPSVISYGHYSDHSFQVTNVEFRLLENSIPNKYILYATGNLLADDGSMTPFTAFIPNRIYN